VGKMQNRKPLPFSQLVIRPLLVQDVQKLQLFQSILFPVYYDQAFYDKLFHERCVTILVFTPNEEELIGVATSKIKESTSWWDLFFPIKREGYIMTFGVSPSFRQRGLGTFILRKMIEILQEHGCNVVTLHVQLINKAAVEFYKKNNFVVAEDLPGHYYIDGQYFDAMKMIFYLNNNNTVQLSTFFSWKDCWSWWNGFMGNCKSNLNE